MQKILVHARNRFQMGTKYKLQSIEPNRIIGNMFKYKYSLAQIARLFLIFNLRKKRFNWQNRILGSNRKVDWHPSWWRTARRCIHRIKLI